MVGKVCTNKSEFDFERWVVTDFWRNGGVGKPLFWVRQSVALNTGLGYLTGGTCCLLPDHGGDVPEKLFDFQLIELRTTTTSYVQVVTSKPDIQLIDIRVLDFGVLAVEEHLFVAGWTSQTDIDEHAQQSGIKKILCHSRPLGEVVVVEIRQPLESAGGGVERDNQYFIVPGIGARAPR